MRVVKPVIHMIYMFYFSRNNKLILYNFFIIYYISDNDYIIKGMRMKILEKRFKVKDRHAGIGAINPMGTNLAAARGNMGNTQAGKTVSVEGTEPPIILTGHEKSLIHGLKQVNVEGEVHILAKVEKRLKRERISTYVFFMDENDIIDVVEIPEHETLDNKMIFKHTHTDTLKDLEEGDVLLDPTFSTTPSNKDGYNAFGVSMDVLFANINTIGEDAIIISDEACEKFAFWQMKETIIDKKPDEHFKNLYGDSSNWKGFPDPGEAIREDGVLYDMFTVDVDNEKMSYDKIDNLRSDYVTEPVPLEDNAVYGKGVVYDIEVITQPKRKRVKNKLDKVNAQVEYYRDAIIAHKKELCEVYMDICVNMGTGLYDTSLKFSPELSILIEDAFTYYDASARYNIKGGIRGIRRVGFHRKPIDTIIKIRTMHRVVPGKGYKLSDMHGAKGIIALVLPAKDMPCDVILNPLATSDRTIPGRLSETYLAGLTRDVREHALELLDETYSEGSVDKAIEYIAGYFAIVTPKLGKTLLEYNHKDRLEFLIDLKENDLHIGKRFQDTDFIEKYELLEASNYAKKKLTATINIPGTKPIHINGTTTKGTLYTTLLNNLPTAAIATDKPRVNSIGLSPSTSKNIKSRYPYNVQATKILSEPETKIMVSYCKPHLIAELRDRMSSTERQRAQCIALLTAKDPANIPVLLDRKKYPYISGIGTTMMNAIFSTGGFELTHTKLIKKGK